MAHQETEEQPLDPDIERVRRKMMRLLVISIGIMMVGLFSVLGAIIYKVSGSSSDDNVETARAPGDVVEINLGLPVSTEILSTTVRDKRLVVDLKTSENKRQLLLIDVETGQLISRVNFN